VRLLWQGVRHACRDEPDARMNRTHLGWFSLVKYLVYSLLTLNVFMFLQEELLALEHTFVGELLLEDYIQAFSATIDTAAWVVLLLLFELETSIIPDERIRGGLKMALHGIRAVCYLFIGYAFYGYVTELSTLYNVQLLPVTDACSLLDDSWSLLVDLDEYETLGAENCIGVTGPLWQVYGFDILAAEAVLRDARWLAWTDVINAGAWILVVIVLEIDVRLQLAGGIGEGLSRANTAVKLLLYSLLFLAAIYWGFAGDFIDFWDAFLWLFAFVFIELNVFDWQAETRATGD
jgi:hypothetical protein